MVGPMFDVHDLPRLQVHENLKVWPEDVHADLINFKVWAEDLSRRKSTPANFKKRL